MKADQDVGARGSSPRQSSPTRGTATEPASNLPRPASGRPRTMMAVGVTMGGGTAGASSNVFASPRSPDLMRPESNRMQGVSASPYNRSTSPSARMAPIGTNSPDVEQAQFRKNVQAYSDRSSMRSRYDPLRTKAEEPLSTPPVAGNNSGKSVEAPQDVNSKSTVKVIAADPFKGNHPLEYALWGHYMSYGAAALGLFCGIFAILWDSPHNFNCEIDGELISSNFIQGVNYSGLIPLCNADVPFESTLQGSSGIGSVYVIYSIFILAIENRYLGFGLYYRSDTVAYVRQFSPLGIMHFAFGVIGLGSYCTVLAGVPYIATSIILSIAAYRQEAGDGGRDARRKASAAAAKLEAEKAVQKAVINENCLECLLACPMRFHDRYLHFFDDLGRYNPGQFYLRLVNEGKLSEYFWTFIFLFINLCCFGVTLQNWMNLIEDMKSGLLDGTLDLNCTACDLNRQMVLSGPPSAFAPWAKASAYCLHLNSMLILFPVTKSLLTRLYNAGVSFHVAQSENSFFAKFCAGPCIRYLPLYKNIDFHKLCAGAIFFFTWIHMICHYANLIVCNDTALVLFQMYGWNYFAYFSGAIITVCGFFIYSGAFDEVRRAKFELFFTPHHFFTLYFFFLFIHATDFWRWGIWPVVLYLIDKYLQSYRGTIPFVVIKVDWIPPVMAIYFRPLVKDTFKFKEGQYLNLNCPAISGSEWHPFTISSAYDDLSNGARIHLASGEEVFDVPRPPSTVWPADAKWSKFCRISQDWRAMQINAPFNLLDKSDTGYFDCLSVHIKVHGDGSWTRRLKEYFEQLKPDKDANGETIFPIYFSRLDQRGDIHIGRQMGPNESPILRVDGPHSAPAEHYFNYQSVMLVGAGIGMTPCASILTSLIRYKWRRNHPTEILHFYWIVRYDELDSFQWFVHLLADLSFDLKRNKDSHQIDKQYYLEINIYVTSVPKPGTEAEFPLMPLKRSSKKYSDAFGLPSFSAEQLYGMLKSPKVDSRLQKEQMSSVASAKNRLQNIWIWNGRPNWDIVFQDMKVQRQHPNIGVCFCGTPVIGAEIKEMCDTYSSVAEDCLFTLHKENF